MASCSLGLEGANVLQCASQAAVIAQEVKNLAELEIARGLDLHKALVRRRNLGDLFRGKGGGDIRECLVGSAMNNILMSFQDN